MYMFEVFWLLFKTRWKEDYRNWFFLLFPIILIFAIITFMIDLMTSNLSKYDTVMALSGTFTFVIIVVGLGLMVGYIVLYRSKK